VEAGDTAAVPPESRTVADGGRGGGAGAPGRSSLRGFRGRLTKPTVATPRNTIVTSRRKAWSFVEELIGGHDTKAGAID